MSILSNNQSDCPFCDCEDRVFENEYAYAKWDIYAVSQGHILIITKRHVSDYFELTNDEKIAMLELLDEAKSHLDKIYNPEGYNIGINVGKDAGQTVMHVHTHLIPRYKGDVDDPRGGVRGVIPEKQKY